MSAHNGTAAKRIDTQDVKTAAAGRWAEILRMRCPELAEAIDADGRHVRCPTPGHDDHNPSFRFSDSAHGKAICSCGTFDGFSLIQELLNVDFPTAVEIVANELGITANTNVATPTRSIIERVAASKRITVSAIEAFGGVIADRDGQAVVRLPVYNERGASHSHFDLGIDGKLAKGMFKPGVGSSGLFFPGKQPKTGEIWFIVEGVKDACALHQLGFKACGLNTCQMNAKYARLFRGCRVFLIPDRDEASAEGFEKTANRLLGVAESVHRVTLPGELTPNNGADVRDVLAKQDGESLVRQAIEDAELVVLASEPRTTNSREAINLTDLGNAERFIHDHHETVRYCHPWHRWLCWDGLRWKVDESEYARRLAKKTVRSIANEANQASDRDERRRLFAWSIRSESVERITALLKCAQSEERIPIAVDDLNQKSWLFNASNGTVDLKTGLLRKPSQDDLMTTASPTAYPPGEIACSKWFGFLNRIFDGNDELIDYIQQLLGLSLVGSVHEHILPILWGGGANGKSVLLETWMRVLGPDYSMKAPQDLLMACRGTSHPTELADLFGKRFVAVVESGQGRRLDEARCKELSGGDRVRARHVNKDFFEFTPSHTAFMATNHRPVVQGTDEGIWRRLRMVPFRVTIPVEEQDKHLVDKLEAEAGHILKWAVQGLLSWRKSGLREPSEVQIATGSYRDSQDVIKDFLAEKCVAGGDGRVDATALYRSYQGWCRTNGEKEMTQRVFGETIVARGYERRKIKGIKRYLGIRLAIEVVDAAEMWTEGGTEGGPLEPFLG